MTPSIRARLEALEHSGEPTGQLPTILPDDAPDSEIERLRAQGLEVYRYSDGVGLFV